MNILQKIVRFFLRYLVSPEHYARYIGVNIGKNCFILTREWSSEPYLVTVGNNVQVTSGVAIHTHGGANAIRKLNPKFDVFGKVVIKDWAYIGAFSQIMPGVIIGEGALVAAGSVVTKSVPPYTVVGGNPARYICTTDEYKSKNEHLNINTKGIPSNEKKKILLKLSDDKFICKPYIKII
ncbi:DapH/DapD/GlmU-related protein [uncultured Bacteroides sp.]|uniref:acyltransferase n=1 Tax=uncultured Bacteroides sp. TaxID=162156 RepID=UPI0025EECFD9|nr:acyltransferase [uncultured Bacteroides sp.]